MRGNQVISQCQVQWGHDGLVDTSWKGTAQFIKHFPEFNFEDKIALDGWSNDMNIAHSQSKEMIHAAQPKEVVTNSGQMASDPLLAGMRRKSTRERISNKQLEDFDDQ
ncbi:hypothetical protein PIB30_051167 [Stylosanthes scabra]|uniref:Uncharacterized protein n=1 Tax=Stylosanthes scabra TaxID=79078 RepID=A0ABU6UIL4_9FABA|nr:hypothetical protein [Stylosanthes scabra]